MSRIKTIAIDFDGTLCKYNFPNVGEPNWEIINKAKAEQESGAKLILWTCREGKLLDEAVTACRGWGLVFDAVNESCEEALEGFEQIPRKAVASEYWDDRAVLVKNGRFVNR